MFRAARGKKFLAQLAAKAGRPLLVDLLQVGRRLERRVIWPPPKMVDGKKTRHVQLFVKKVAVGNFSPRLVRVDAEIETGRPSGHGWRKFELTYLMSQLRQALFQHGFEFSPARHWRTGKEVAQQHLHANSTAGDDARTSSASYSRR